MTPGFSTRLSSLRTLACTAVILITLATLAAQHVAATGVLFVDWWGAAGTAASAADANTLQLSIASAAGIANSRVRILQSPTIAGAFFLVEVVDSSASTCATSTAVQQQLVGASVTLQGMGGLSVVVKDMSIAAPRSLVEIRSTADKIAELFASAPSLIAVAVVVLLLGVVGLLAISAYFLRNCRKSRFADADDEDNDDHSATTKELDDDFEDFVDGEEDEDILVHDGNNHNNNNTNAGDDTVLSKKHRRAMLASSGNHSSNKKRKNPLSFGTDFASGMSTGRSGGGGGGGGGGNTPTSSSHDNKTLWWQEEAPPVLLLKDDALALSHHGADRLAEAVGLSPAATDRLLEHLDEIVAEQQTQNGAAASLAPLAALTSCCTLRELVRELDLDHDDRRALTQMLSLATACHAWKIMPPADDADDWDEDSDDDIDDPEGEEERRVRAEARRRLLREKLDDEYGKHHKNRQSCCGLCCMRC